MSSITKANAKHHCRTCLLELETPGQPTESVNIASNSALEDLLSKLFEASDLPKSLGDYPQSVCVSCFRTLEDFVKFYHKAKECWHTLNSVLTGSDLLATDEKPVTDEPEINNEDIYKLLLLETETVLLDNTAGGEGSVDSQDPDPFGGTPSVKVEEALQEVSLDEWPGSGSSGRDANSEDDESSDEASHSCGLKDDTPENPDDDSESPSTRSKTKRRSEEGPEEERESSKSENTSKRRNKGSRNSFKCQQCNHCFAHKITLDAHVRKVHEGSKRPFQCDRCDKAYTFIGGLYTHIKEIHDTVERCYKCDHPDCDRTYTSFIAMQKHKRLKHSDKVVPKKYVCEQCGSTFNQSGNLKYHRRTKHPTADEQAEREQTKERFECEICKKLFHSRYTLKYHTLQLHSHDTKYECNVCGRRMAKKFMLVQHMLVHSTDKMPCEHCGKQFIRKFELEAHIRAVHMKLKPFECQYCSECFASRKTLRHHEYIHTGEKPYVCDICGLAYRQQTCLKNHRKSHEKLSANAASSRLPSGDGPPLIVEPPPPLVTSSKATGAMGLP